MSKHAIVIGGGHNGLVAASYLAQAGMRVTVLEARDVVGGAAVTEELIPGYRMSSCSFVVGLLRPEVIRDLGLIERHGLELYLPQEAISCTIFDDGSHFFLWRELDRTLRDIERQFGREDVQGLLQFGMDTQRVERILGPTIMGPPPPLSELVRRFEAAGAHALFERFIVGSVRDLAEHYFRSERLRGHFVFPGVVSMHGGPSSPGTAYLLAYHTVGEFLGQFGQWGFARGGMGSISAALAKSAAANGAMIRTGASVKRICSRAGHVSGVELVDGRVLDADIVLSNADPQTTFLKLVSEGQLPREFVEQIRSLDMRGSMARVYVAVDELPRFIGFDSEGPGPQHEGHLFLGPTTERFENGWDAQRRGRIPDDIALELLIDTVRDPALAPPGHHVLIAGVQQLPFTLADSDWDSEKPRLTQRVLDKLLHFAPNLRGHIRAVHCHTPLDLQRIYGLTGGNIFHGGMSLSRIMANRPGMLRNGYGAPIEGLYLCGSGAHPGGGVMGASGFNCAMAVLTDQHLVLPRPWEVPSVSGGTASRTQTLLQSAFARPGIRSLLTSLATRPWSRPLARFLTRSKVK